MQELETAKLHTALRIHVPAFGHNDTISAPCRFFTRSSAKAITHQLGADTKEAFLRIKLLEWNPTVFEKNMIVMATNTAGLSYDPLRNSQKWR